MLRSRATGQESYGRGTWLQVDYTYNTLIPRSVNKGVCSCFWLNCACLVQGTPDVVSSPQVRSSVSEMTENHL